eukprot:CAMPEP_0202457386 /NCGR_PEP_ID=MMETSP1360-20130828/14423_1 /ASSEMBLY_ACC=CAM_ASM_000848 /TAXON_ID=515479 /ORGANISM="Licmophora paradoxa, Strain CCMP2313" /LENGTH=190 /DNA_ID=CAMNT_0049077463 /DNA_START=158 /DNA_END=730 /DNA_ORIENTATION=-
MISLFGDRLLVVASIGLGAVESVIICMARSKSVIFLSICLGSLKTLDNPLLTSMASKDVDETQQGKVQGAMAAVGALAEAVGPPIINYIYRNVTLFGMGTMFLAGGILQFSAAAISLMIPERQSQQQRQQHAQEEEDGGMELDKIDEVLVPFRINEDDEDPNNFGTNPPPSRQRSFLGITGHKPAYEAIR